MVRLEIDQLASKHLGPISIALAGPERVGVTGPSGAGKSMLLRAVADMDPHRGQIRLDGHPCTQMPAFQWRRMVGLLPSESHWWFDTVGEHFDVNASPLLQMLGFEADVGRWLVNRLSSGERQRLALLRLLSNRPQVLLLDEPTANLDMENTLKVEKVIKIYQKGTDAPILWVSHDVEQLKRVTSRFFTMRNGGMVGTSTASGKVPPSMLRT